MGVWGAALSAFAREVGAELGSRAASWLREGRGGWAALTLTQALADTAREEEGMPLCC